MGAIRLFREPAVINAAQIIGNFAAAFTGALAAIGGVPVLITGTIGPVLAVGVGTVLFIGGTLGAVTVLTGTWWLERVALLIMGLGWFLLLPACLFAVTRNSAVWLVVALIMTALSDVVKRYKRIEWAYLDPHRGAP